MTIKEKKEIKKFQETIDVFIGMLTTLKSQLNTKEVTVSGAQRRIKNMANNITFQRR